MASARLRGLVLVAALLAGSHAEAQVVPRTSRAPRPYRCPMHPDVRADAPGACRACGMPLIRAGQVGARYGFEVEATPPAIAPGVDVTLLLRITDPMTGAIARDFEEVHERRLHLFVVSSDLAWFVHDHPTPSPDGRWRIPVRFPRSGAYQLIADFYPTGDAPQLVQRTVLVGGPGLTWPAPQLVRDDARPKVDGEVAVTIVAGELRARQAGFLHASLTAARTGRPIADLELYLGATAHLLVVSEDLADVAHAHAERVGDSLRFELRPPRAGRYRLWLQYQRAGRVATVPFTIEVPASR